MVELLEVLEIRRITLLREATDLLEDLERVEGPIAEVSLARYQDFPAAVVREGPRFAQGVPKLTQARDHDLFVIDRDNAAAKPLDFSDPAP